MLEARFDWHRMVSQAITYSPRGQTRHSRDSRRNGKKKRKRKKEKKKKKENNVTRAEVRLS